MQEDSSRSPSYTVTCEDYVHVVEFSPFSCGSPASLLAYGGNQYVVVGTCLFQVRAAASPVTARPRGLFAQCELVPGRRRTWRQKEWNSMYFGLSTMICALTLWLGAQSPGWTGYPLSGTAFIVSLTSRCDDIT